MPTIGQTKEVAYNPDQPNQSSVVDGAGTTLAILIFPVAGVAMIVVSSIFFVKSIKRSKSIGDLKNSGHKIQGVLTDIQSASNNNYRVTVSATDNNNTVRNYISDPLSGLGSLAMSDFRTNPIPVSVYIDPSNPQNYYVDADELPNLTPQRISEMIQSATGSRAMPTASQGAVNMNQPQPQTYMQQASPQPAPIATQPPTPAPQHQAPTPTTPYSTMQQTPQAQIVQPTAGMPSPYPPAQQTTVNPNIPQTPAQDMATQPTNSTTPNQ